jgi:hypothetical protein
MLVNKTPTYPIHMRVAAEWNFAQDEGPEKSRTCAAGSSAVGDFRAPALYRPELQSAALWEQWCAMINFNGLKQAYC